MPYDARSKPMNTTVTLKLRLLKELSDCLLTLRVSVTLKSNVNTRKLHHLEVEHTSIQRSVGQLMLIKTMQDEKLKKELFIHTSSKLSILAGNIFKLRSY